MSYPSGMTVSSRALIMLTDARAVDALRSGADGGGWRSAARPCW